MMSHRIYKPAYLVILGLLALAGQCRASSPTGTRQAALDHAFKGAQVVDLRTSREPCVVKLRETVKIPPPEAPILVKVFKRESLPGVLKPIFANKGIAGVTINGRYIAILHTPFDKEHHDILQHELVHAYITMASPLPLPFWFQEGSAVHFSTDKGRKFYGQPSKKERWVMEGRVVDLSGTYKQKLQSFHFLIDKVGKDRFYKWYREAVLTGKVDARPLLGLEQSDKATRTSFKKPISIWLIVIIAVVVIVVAVAGYISVKRGGDYY